MGKLRHCQPRSSKSRPCGRPPRRLTWVTIAALLLHTCRVLERQLRLESFLRKTIDGQERRQGAPEAEDRQRCLKERLSHHKQSHVCFLGFREGRYLVADQ